MLNARSVRDAHKIARYTRTPGTDYRATYAAVWRLSRWDYVRLLAEAEGRIPPAAHGPVDRRQRWRAVTGRP